MVTKLKEFQLELATLEKSKSLPDVLKKCYEYQGTSFSKDRVCLTYDENNQKFRDINGSIVSNLPSTWVDGTAISYGTTTTYGSLEAIYVSFTDAGSLNNYNTDLSTVQTSLTNPENKFNNLNKDNINLYSTMKSKRGSLDTKMRELYEDENTDTQSMFENSIYANLSITVLATCLLYLLFVKL